MDPNEKLVVKLYITSAIALVAFVVVFGALAMIHEGQLATPTMTASVHNALIEQLP